MSDKTTLFALTAICITAFRELIRSVLEHEAGGCRRSVVILALDGIPYDLARVRWSHAVMEKMRSVFPTTSSAAWLSCLSGEPVAQHGIPGVVFMQDGELVNVYEHAIALDLPRCGNIFSDSTTTGYEPVVLLGDWEPVVCTWRDALLRHARLVTGNRFYTAPQLRSARAMAEAVGQAIDCCLAQGAEQPRLLWCFVEVDRHIHVYGYDEHVLEFLDALELIALQLVEAGTVVVAHSDHGLIPTRHSPEIDSLLRHLSNEFGCAIGGAGRTRWIYSNARNEDRLISSLRSGMPSSVHIDTADAWFPPGSLARSRVGEIVLIARGGDFITLGGQFFDHGSDTDVELYVPYALWRA